MFKGCRILGGFSGSYTHQPGVLALLGSILHHLEREMCAFTLDG